MLGACFQGLEDLTLDWNEQDLPLSGKWKITTTVEKSSESIGLPSPVTTTSLLSTGTGFPEWTSSVEDFPASLLVVPGSSEARKMTVTSGQKWLDVYKGSGPLGSLVRMCLESSIWGSNRCALTWKVSVIKRKHLLFRLVPLTRHTSVNASGLLPTPTARTPGSKHHSGTTLVDAVRLWPTPHSNCGTGAGTSGRKGGMNIQTAVAMDQEAGLLNPAWVEWLMGYPTGWTDLGASAIRLSRKSRKRLDA